MNLSIWIYTKLFGKLVGKDQFGNKYYQSTKKSAKNAQLSRWVYYKGKAEPSKIPPSWHSWLHHQTNNVPKTTRREYKWEKEMVPNLTGTEYAYYPDGHVLAEGKRNKISSDHQAWDPKCSLRGKNV